MTDVTELMLKYRECSRHLWNMYFRPSSHSEMWDLRDQFDAIDRQLFLTLVLGRLGVDREAALQGDRPIEELKVTLASDQETPIMISRPSTDGNSYWDCPVTRASNPEIDLRFISFFDWNKYGVADLSYLRVRISDFPRHSDLVGRDALVEVSNCRVLSTWKENS